MKKDIKDLFIIFTTLFVTFIIGKYLSNIHFREENIVSIFILGVFIISTQIDKYILGILSCILSVLTFNFFFTAPKYSFEIHDPKYIITFTVMLIISLIIITLISRIKNHIKIIEKNSKQLKILLDLNEELQKNYTKESIIESSLLKISKIFNRKVYFERYSSTVSNNIVYLEEFSYYIFDNNIYFPLTVKKEVYGILYMDISGFDESDFYFLFSIINQILLILEKFEIINEIRKIEFQIEEEKFKTNILRSISHDLRTPLTSISGSANSLLTRNFSNETSKKLILNIYEESNWLIELIENLLSLSKIQNIKVLTKQFELVEDIVEEAIQHANKDIANYQLKINIEENLTVKCDGNLLIQVLINLLNNALKYSFQDKRIEIIAFKKNSNVIFQIKDNGVGILDKDKKNIFNSFHTKRKASGDNRRGLGLGLFLCKSIIQCHNGEIFVTDNIPQGSVFQFTIPE